jgi:DNA-3-methyladenine glycosylase II
MSQESWRAAAEILAGRDPVLARLIEQAGPVEYSPPTGPHFDALVQAIVYQQLAGPAAAAIHRRLIAAVDGTLSPERLLGLPPEMFLMLQLGRVDVWPTGDLGVRKGFGLAWGIPTPTAKELEPLGDPYRPYRSVVAWYCWRVTAAA